jgi:hypothetical protein
MNFEIIMSYVNMGLMIACIYYTFKIVGCVVDYVAGVFKTAMKPEPNRKRTTGNLSLNNYLEVAIAANEFGFNNNNPITENELKRRFRKKIKKVHPDHGGNDNDFIRVKKAYDLLLSL